MDKKIETCVRNLLKERVAVSRYQVESHIVAKLEVSNLSAARVINLMKDREEIEEYAGTASFDRIPKLRLTANGVAAHKSNWVLFGNYLLRNWIAIVALLLSIANFIRAIYIK